MEKTILSSRGQIVIPKYTRIFLGLHEGMEFFIHHTSDQTIELKPIRKSINAFFNQGSKLDIAASTIEEMDDRVGEMLDNENS